MKMKAFCKDRRFSYDPVQPSFMAGMYHAVSRISNITAADIYDTQRVRAKEERRRAAEEAATLAEQAEAQAEAERKSRKERQFRDLKSDVRQGVVASLGLKSRKLRGLMGLIDGVATPEQLADFCREHIKYRLRFPIIL
eukprot:COSAG05_NODE_3548_length_1998_cov_1.643497_2_plen_139_part_00